MEDTHVIRDRLHVSLNRPAVLTIGVFDGLHLGHQHLIRVVRERAAVLGCLAGVITLHPHPQSVLSPGSPIAYLTTLEERLQRIRAQEVDWMAVLAFDRLVADETATSFLSALRRQVPFRELWVGPDFALGRGREGNPARLREMGEREGFRVDTVPPLYIDGEIVNSTRIRQLVAAGEVRQAAALLGRFPSLTGPVVPGDQRGRTMGFPTANLRVGEDILVPANGVYATYAHWDDRCAAAVVNIGNRPTFDNGARSIEAYLLDVRDDLYGQEMTLELRERLRGEVRFPGPEALVAQINEDIRQARTILRAAPAGAGGTEGHPLGTLPR